MSSVVQSSNQSTEFQGWTPSPEGRGSIGIIWTCLIALGLCSWSAVCVNIPTRGDSGWRKVRRKAWLTFICLVGPEYLLALAIGQWSAAYRSVQEFKDLSSGNWTIRHGFFAEMGGFMLHTADGVAFPVRTKGLLYLIHQGFITDKTFKEKILVDPQVIKDRNKADTLFRLLALAQALWFVINCLARFIQHLPVTTLELTVLGFFIPTATTYILWWNKPCDVDTAEVITIDARLDEIRARGGPAGEQQWHYTPLDFVDREEWHGSLLYRYWLNILGRLNLLSRPKSSSARTRQSDNDFLPSPLTHLFFLELLPTVPFLGVNYIAWNHDFPTIIERDMWRTASVTMTATFLIGASVEGSFTSLWPFEKEKSKSQTRRLELEQYYMQQQQLRQGDGAQQQNPVFPGAGHGLPPSSRTRLHKFKMAVKRLVVKLCNNSPNDDPNLDVPFKMLILATPLAALYCISRAYVLVEDAIAFRRMPSGTYTTVDWMQFLPHFG